MTSVDVTATGPAAEAVRRHVPDLVHERFASRLFDTDATLWGPGAEPEASKRLGWLGLPRSSRPLVGELAALRDELTDRGVDRVVLCGMGGSSLAPEVICATAGVPLVVLDSSHPDQVRRALTDLERTVVVVSSKSGSTVETDSQRRIFEQAFADAGLEVRDHLVVVTDPGSPLDEDARGRGLRVVNADPSVGGRYSALTAFGLVPSALAGVDVEALLDDAEAVVDVLAEDDEGNPGLRLGAAMAGTDPLRDKLVLAPAGTHVVGFADWAEQLIAESTGKDGTGILPVVLESVDQTEGREQPDDVTLVRLVDPEDEPTVTDGSSSVVAVGGSLGAQLLLWEVATAVAGRILEINPFDQPDVESAKQAARDLLDGGSSDVDVPQSVDGDVEIRTTGEEGLSIAATVEEALAALLTRLDTDHGYLAVMAYLDREGDSALSGVDEALAARTGRPVTFGWGPRFLHSTGQYHKGGPATGVYLQITDTPREDMPVPGRDFTLGQFIAAQAGGDAAVLHETGRPVLRLHARTPEGVARIADALRAQG